jgi:predicted phosphoribosyltransferase
MHFKDRKHAGRQLANALKAYRRKDVVVYALPRGGVVLGIEVAKHLGAKFGLLIPRKIGHPNNPEYAVAVVGESGEVAVNPLEKGVEKEPWFEAAVKRELAEARRRREVYLSGQMPPKATGKICIIVDDGLATGLTMQAAVKDLKKQKPKKIIVAVPVAPAEAVKNIGELVDEAVVLYVPAGFFSSVGAFYQDFDQVTDEEVVSLIRSLKP